MPPRRSAAKGKATRAQQSKITDRNLRTIKRSHDSDLKPKVQQVDTEKKTPKRAAGIKRGVHQEHLSETDILLRKFDLDYKFGPCVGLTRIERWNRAQKLGLEPPQSVKDVLDNTNEACVFEL
ncbi:DNA polymerase delta, subunit 4-domain-containing protein [Fennellomyces sp. T-0311]|nr:DNA polymerase delta, subunit 4-domain-containing protein [Fennellomyces sp. T-0311]